MLPIHSLIILACFTLLGFVMTFFTFRLRKKSIGIFGKPTIAKLSFYSGKISVVIGWALFMIKAIFPEFGWIPAPEWLSWTAVVLMCIATLLMTVALTDLGGSLRVGLPEQSTSLKTKGIFAFSRNPIYLAVFMISLASCLYFPDPVNTACCIVAVATHLKIIKGEEEFLAIRFGDEWRNYSGRVRRFI